MKKLILLITAIALATLSSTVSATSQQHCYELTHGKDGLGSTNSAFTSYIRSEGPYKSYITVTNTGWEKVNLRIIMRDDAGDIYVPTDYSNRGSFEQANILFGQNEWTILKPFHSTEILIGDELMGGHYSAQITWQADQCLENALIGTVITEYSEGNHHDQIITRLNDGMVF